MNVLRLEPERALTEYPITALGKERFYVPGKIAGPDPSQPLARKIHLRRKMNHSVSLTGLLSLEQVFWLIEPSAPSFLTDAWITPDPLVLETFRAPPALVWPLSLELRPADGAPETTWCGHTVGWLAWVAAKLLEQEVNAPDYVGNPLHCLAFEQLTIRRGVAEFFVGS